MQRTPTAAERQISSLWQNERSADWAYFEKVDEDGLSGFWDESGVFAQAFSRLDLTVVCEIAGGWGRHAAKIVDRCGQLHVMDVSEGAVQHLAARFQGRDNVFIHHVPSGNSLSFLESGSATGVYSYDAMVHFEPTTIADYLLEIARVLVPGGRALLHHSNNSKQPGVPFAQMNHWRNYMSESLFRHFAGRAGLHIDQYMPIKWGAEEIDALTLLARPLEP